MPDYQNYPRSVLEFCEAELKRKNVPRWFVDRFAVAEESRPKAWGSVRTLGYQWPIPIVTDAGISYPVDIFDRIATDAWQLLELAAVARAWLACFGERSAWELALVYEFAHLDALRVRRWVQSEKQAEKARAKAEKNRKELSPRNQQIVFDALALIDGGTTPHKLVAELAADEAYKNTRTGRPLSDRQLRHILIDAGILQSKRKK